MEELPQGEHTYAPDLKTWLASAPANGRLELWIQDHPIPFFLECMIISWN